MKILYIPTRRNLAAQDYPLKMRHRTPKCPAHDTTTLLLLLLVFSLIQLYLSFGHCRRFLNSKYTTLGIRRYIQPTMGGDVWIPRKLELLLVSVTSWRIVSRNIKAFCLTWMLAALYLRILSGVFFFFISSLSFGMCSGLFYPTVLESIMYLFSSLLCSAEYGRRTIAEWAYVLSSNIEIMGVS